MPCFSPLRGYRALEPGPSGKRGITFNPSAGFIDRPIQVPCGQCVGCRLERSRQWAVRCVLESKCHDQNAFVTLTYDDAHLPVDMSVDVRHFQLFMKRLRKKYGSGVRFFHCGEYGELNKRPHYHALLFNLDFEDKKLWSMSRDNPVFVSESLNEVWGLGFTSIGAVTFQSAAYVARYVLKKITGPCSEAHYAWVDAHGVRHVRRPEYITMSRRPGIGSRWYERYSGDLYPDDFVVMDGRKVRVPRFYDNMLSTTQEELHTKVKRGRKQKALRHTENNTRDRLRVREVVQLARMQRLKRGL